MGIERRKFARVRIPLLVQYRVNPLEEFRTDYASDISEGGIFLSNDLPLPEGTVVQIQFVTRDMAHLIAAEARIVRSHGKDGQGVQFVRLDPQDLAALRALVERAQAGVVT